MTSSSSLGTEFYFHCAVAVIGVVGTAANALILYAMWASKQHKKQVLIFNQNVLDFFSSFFMVVSYSLKLCNIHLSGSVGYWLCMMLLSDSLIWTGAVGSVINLGSITIERYLKVVHPISSKKKLHNWVIYSAMTFSWIGSFIYNAALVFPTTAVLDGACHPYVIWNSETEGMISFIYSLVSFYIIILLIFVYCYWRILIVIRRQARVMAIHNANGPSAAQHINNQIQANVIKTMIFVSAFYAISWLPHYIYVMYMTVSPNVIFVDFGYYVALSVAFLYTCTNPFVYATKFDPVKQVLLGLIHCKKTTQ